MKYIIRTTVYGCIRPFVAPALLLLIFSSLFNPLTAQETPATGPLITVTVKDKPLIEALAIIEARTRLRFVYATDLLHGQPPVSITATAMPLQDFLSLLFRQPTLTWHIYGNQVVLDGPERPVKVTLSGYIR